MPAPRSRRAALALALALGIAMLGIPGVFGAREASAHSKKGMLTIIAAEPSPGPAISIEVGLTFADDDDLVFGAEVTAQLVGPEGARVGPVTLTSVSADSARYRAVIGVPTVGAWSISVSSSDPVASAETTVTVVGSSGAGTTGQGATVTPPPPLMTTAVTVSPPSTAASTTTAASSGSPTTTAVPLSEATENKLNTLIAGAVISLIVIAVLGFMRRRRAGDTTDAPSGESGGSPSGD